MPTQRQLHAQDLQRLRRLDRELAQDLRRSEGSTRRIVGNVARQAAREAGRSARAGRILRSAWRRPPERSVRARLGQGGWKAHAGGGRRSAGTGGPGAGPERRTIHFRLDQTSSGRDAAEHQSYIERTEAVVESFGTIAETREDRMRWWREVGERTDKKTGCITITGDADEALRGEVAARALEWGEEGRLGVRKAREVSRLGERAWEGGRTVKIRTFSADDHQRICGWLREWQRAEQERREAEEEAEREEAGQAAPEEAPAKRRMYPEGVRLHAPREGVVQRRVVLELASELSQAEMRGSLEQWCEAVLTSRGLAYHAVVHQPEANNDARNWHAHVVYTGLPVERERTADGRETGRFTIEAEDRLPPMAEAARVLGGSGPEGKEGARKLVTAWRRKHADVQNAWLAKAGIAKRYDPRSYAAMGDERIPGAHHGTKRAALETSGRGADEWPAHSPEWEEERRTLEQGMAAEGIAGAEASVLRAELERVRLLGGLYSRGGAAQERTEAARQVEEEAAAEPLPRLEGTAGEWQETLQATQRMAGAGQRVPRWAARWRSAKRESRSRVELDAVGAEIADGHPGGAEALAAEVRPEARAVAGAARRHGARRERWRQRIERVRSARGQEAQEEEARRAMRELVRIGVDPRLLLEEEDRRLLKEAAARARIRRRAQEILRGIEGRVATEADPERLEEARQRYDRHERALVESDRGRRAAEAAERRLAEARDVAAVRTSWTAACAEGAEAVADLLAGGRRHRLWPRGAAAERRAFRALTPEEQAAMHEARQAPGTAAERGRAAGEEAAYVLERLYGAGAAPGEGGRPPAGRLNEVAGNAALMRRLAATAPTVHRLVERAARRLDRERQAVAKALRAVGAGTGTPHSERLRRLRLLEPAEAVRIAARGPEVLHEEDATAWGALAPALERWAGSVGRGPGAVEVGSGEIELLRVMGTAAGEEGLERAVAVRERREAEGRRLHAALRTAVRALRRADSTEGRARAEHALRTLLADAASRARLGEAVARRTEQRYGLAERGAEPATRR